jgi:glycosyltransferase involved in cell wall biosynthesis
LVFEPRKSGDVIRVAFTLIGGDSWTGGYNYLLNLLRALSAHASGRVQPVLYLGDDLDEKHVAPFARLAGIEVVRTPCFRQALNSRRLRDAISTGSDQSAVNEFREHRIDVIFEAARYYGWRVRTPAIAWIPDFQHRYLKQLFGFKGYWRREFGFRAQVLSGRQVMLSSEDARQDCERFYPATRGRTHVVHFAIPSPLETDPSEVEAISARYGLSDGFFFLPNQFWVHKNHEVVIEALRLLSARGIDVAVAASGLQVDPRQPGHFQRLKMLVQGAGLERSFAFLGLIPHDHVLALMRASSALINPSRFEGWSTTVEEAKATGTPMILSSLAVHKEQAQDKALYFEKDSPEQLARILETFDPLTAKQRLLLAQKARIAAANAVRLFAEQFSKLAESMARPQASSARRSESGPLSGTRRRDSGGTNEPDRP